MSAGAAPSSLGAPLGQRAHVEYARTADGWDLALHHYRGTRSDMPPAILCAGYACNRYFFDFDDHYSLARFLARQGGDAWVLELRGHGYSEPVPGRRSHAYTFDDLVQFDVPAAVAYVRNRSNNRRPVWIGHSMGGMIVYAALGHNPTVQDAVAGVVTLASPVGFPAVSSQVMRGLGGLLLALPLPGRLPQHGVLVALWSALGWAAPDAVEIGMNPMNVDRQAFGQALRLTICNVPRSMLRQLAQWSLSGKFQSADRRIDYRANLSRITTPALIIAGTADHLASPEMVHLAYDHISSTRKQYREFGAHSGDSADYGHIDLVFGWRAPDEVFPVVRAWIEDELTRS